MLRKIGTILFIAAGGLLIVLAALGCGEDKSSQTQTQETLSVPSVAQAGGQDLNKVIDELKKKPLTVEIVLDSKSSGKWTQDGKGSWRYDTGPDTYTIYNAAKQKGWTVSGKTATEITDTNSLQYSAAGSPISLLGVYSSFAAVPRTGGTDDTWEWNIAGLGSLRIEFKGPGGLISKIDSEMSSSGKTNLEFIYSNVDNVPVSAFELPADVQVITPATGGTGGVTTIPGGTDIPGGSAIPGDGTNNVPSGGSYPSY